MELANWFDYDSGIHFPFLSLTANVISIFRISFYPSGFVHKDLSGYIPKMMMVIYLDIQPERERNIRANDFNSIIVMVDFPPANQH